MNVNKPHMKKYDAIAVSSEAVVKPLYGRRISATRLSQNSP